MPKVRLLYSYTYLRKHPQTIIDWMLSHPATVIMLDSGGYSLKYSPHLMKGVTIESYVEFVKLWKPKLGSYVTFDVPHDQEKTISNYEYLYNHGLKPIFVVTYDPPIKLPSCRISNPVAIAGDKKTMKKNPKLFAKWIRHVQNTVGPNRNYHILGTVNRRIIETFKPYSCDATTHLNANMYGNFTGYLGSGRWQWFTRKDFLKGKVESTRELELLCQRAGASITDLYRPEAWKGPGPIEKIVFYSWVQYALELEQRLNTRLYLACSASNWQNISPIFNAINRVTGSDYPLIPPGVSKKEKKNVKRKNNNMHKKAGVRRRTPRTRTLW